MKRLLCFALALILALSLCACVDGNGDKGSDSSGLGTDDVFVNEDGELETPIIPVG